MSTDRKQLTPFAKGVSYAKSGLDIGACSWSSQSEEPSWATRCQREFEAGHNSITGADDAEADAGFPEYKGEVGGKRSVYYPIGKFSPVNKLRALRREVLDVIERTGIVHGFSARIYGRSLETDKTISFEFIASGAAGDVKIDFHHSPNSALYTNKTRTSCRYVEVINALALCSTKYGTTVVVCDQWKANQKVVA